MTDVTAATGDTSATAPDAPPSRPRSRQVTRSSRWRQAPLWLRLVAAVLVLGALALLVNAVVGTRLLRNYMVGQVDKDLHTNAQSTAQNLTAVTNETDYAPFDYVLYMLGSSGEVLGSRVSQVYDADSQPDIPSLTFEEAAERNGRPFTVKSSDGDLRWRVVAYAGTSRLQPYDQLTVLVATPLDDVDDATARLGAINILVGLCLLAGLALAGYGIVRSSLRPLDEMEDTAVSITGGDLTRRVPDDDPATEVGRLGLAFNHMLDRIETAFRDQAMSEEAAIRSEHRMRQFVADASHELRTPLTSIRGFAELYRQGAVTEPAATGELLGRIEDQATRMGTLVDDLLLLARLDQQRPLAHDPVDLVTVAGDAVEAAQVRDHDRAITLATAGDTELYVLGDEQRLRQVLTNLVDNALMHTPAETPVEVRVRRRLPVEPRARGWAVVEVRDAGPGLTAEQAERVFERFYRTDTARSRARGGTGLGLSIVGAIAGAHGGRAEVDTAPGEGATFRVLLPLPDAPPDTRDTPVVPDDAVPDDAAPAEPSQTGAADEPRDPEADQPEPSA